MKPTGPIRPPSEPFWLTAFLDLPAAEYDVAAAHWQRLLGWPRSATRGAADEFATYLPSDGDPYLRVQRIGAGPRRIHLDLHVSDPAGAAATAVAHGARQLADRGYRVMQSPGGFDFCFVGSPASRRPRASRWPDGHTSILDQVCMDIPADHWETETAFWSAITGWAIHERDRPFRRLDQPQLPLKLLLQRLDDPAGPVRAHLDWATDHRQAEIDRQVSAGSQLVRRYPQWTVMDGPGGIYCITGRRPDHPTPG